MSDYSPEAEALLNQWICLSQNMRSAIARAKYLQRKAFANGYAALLEQQLPRFEAVKSGVIDPERCDRCEYCRESRVLMGPELLGDFDEMGGMNE